MTSVSARQRRFASFMADVLIYVTVLNLFVEFSDAVIIDSFTISILTAIVLKILLDVILAAEQKVSDFFTRRQRPLSKVLRVVAVWLILFSSKFVILEVVDLVFGEHVELGKLIEVILIVVVMLASKALVARFFDWLGNNEPVPAPS